MFRHLLPFLAVAFVACADAPAPDFGQAPPVLIVSDTTTASTETLTAFDRVMAAARNEALHERSFGEIVQAVGETLMGTPYRDGLLDAGLGETLVVDLTAFDAFGNVVTTRP